MAHASNRLIEMTRRGLGWVRGRPVAVDVTTAVVVAVMSFAELAVRADRAERAVDGPAVALVLVGSSVLFARREAPLRVLVFVVAALVVFYLRDYGTLAPALGLSAIYAGRKRLGLSDGLRWTGTDRR